MFGHGYGGSYPPEDRPHYPHHQEQSAMIQGRYQDPPPRHLQHHPSQYDSSPFHRHNSLYPPEERHNSHYPPAGPPPFWPPDAAPRPDAPPPSYPPQASSFYPPQYESFHPPPPQQPHSAFYPPQHGAPHSSSFGEHFPPPAAYQHGHTHPSAFSFEERHHSSSEFVHVSSFGQHGGPPSVDAHGHQFPVPQQSSSFHQHTPSVEAGKPLILERESVAITEISNFANPQPANVELPKGQLVRVFCKANRSFNLVVKDNRLLMVMADTEDEFQQWIRDDRYSIRVRDSYGHPAFMLINKGSKKALRHGRGKLQEVQLTDYTPEIQNDDLFWTESEDFGEGFKTVRPASDTLLNLSVASSRNNIEDGSVLVLDTWHKRENQLWKIFPL